MLVIARIYGVHYIQSSFNRFEETSSSWSVQFKFSFSLLFIGYHQLANFVWLQYPYSKLRNHTRFYWSPLIRKPHMTPISFVKTTESYEICRWIIRLSRPCIAAIAVWDIICLKEQEDIKVFLTLQPRKAILIFDNFIFEPVWVSEIQLLQLQFGVCALSLVHGCICLALSGP